MRISEYAAHDGQDFDYQKAVKGRNFTFARDGQKVKVARDAEEVSTRLDSSKADVFNAGEVRNHWRSGDVDLCVLEALASVSGKSVSVHEDAVPTWPQAGGRNSAANSDGRSMALP